MTSGYRMAQYEFRRRIEALFPPTESVSAHWTFLEAEPLLDQGPNFEEVKRHLAIGSKQAFKAWYLSKGWSAAGIISIVCMSLALLYAGWLQRDTVLITVGGVGEAILGALAALIVGPTVVRVARLRQTIGQIGLVTAAALVAAIVFKVHLAVFDRIYLSFGRLSRFKKRAPAGASYTPQSAK
jgi:hypothetical protein